MKRALALAAATTLALAACGSDTPDAASPITETATVTVTVTAPSPEGQAADPGPTTAAEEDAEQSTETETRTEPAPDSEAAPSELKAGGPLGGTATVTDLDAGEPGVITAVHIGKFDPDSSVLPFIFRNNTDEAISHVDASATVRDADGKLTASGSSQGTTPTQIPPGGLAMSYIFLQDGQVPDDATVDFTFDASPADTSLFNTGDLTITEVESTGDGVVGTATNENDATLTGPYGVDIYCFDEAGTLIETHRGYANERGDLQPGDAVSFSETFYGDPCPTFLLGVSGYFN